LLGVLPQQLLGLLLGCHLREHRWQKFKNDVCQPSMATTE
jgi:hypothetical protein